MNHQDGKYAIEVPIDPNLPEEYHKHEIRHAKMLQLEAIREQLWHGRWWAIRITEKRPEQWELDTYNLTRELPCYQLFFDVRAIETEHVHIYEAEDYTAYSVPKLAITALGEIRDRLYRKLRHAPAS